jgi:flagellin
MTVINTNVGALTARTYAVKANESMQKSMERLSSGLRINSAADDAAGLAVANKMESQLRGMNMAIRNSQDGISLVQTAEAGMGEITNMIIRMRELAVQMNNGVYTDSDRQNAQLEVTALLSEIDKIADNTAFNDVKVLDGSYSADIRAGNTNAEIINVAVKRMKTDALGGNTLAADSESIAQSANIDTSAYRATKSVMNLTANESSNVIIKEGDLSSEMVNFASGRTGTYSMAGSDANLFNVVTSGGSTTFETQSALNFVSTDKNSYSFSVTFTDSNTAETFTDELTLAITDNTSSAAVKSSSSTMSVSESQGIRFNAVDTTLDPNDATNNSGDGALSTSLQSFVLSDTATDGTIRGSFSISGADAGSFNVSATGEVTASIDFEANGSTQGNNAYSFNVVYTNSTGDEFTESVTMNVTNSSEEVYTVNSPNVPSSVKQGDTFSIQVNDGTNATTITATVGADSSSYSAGDVATALNAANAILANPVGVTFAADASGSITTTYDDALGDIQDRRVVEIANGASAGAQLSTALAAASSGATFTVTVGSDTYTARLDNDAAEGSYSMDNLISDLNAVDQSGMTDANKVSFEKGDDGAILVRFDQQGTNTTTVSAVSFDTDGTSAAAVARQVMFEGADLASSFAASDESGDAFTVTVNDGTSATTFTFTSTSAGDAVTNVADLATQLNAATAGNSAANRMVTFSADNGQLKVTFDQAGASANDYSVTIDFDDNSDTADATDLSTVSQITAGVATLGGSSGTVSTRGDRTTADVHAGFSAQALKFNAVEFETGTVSTTTTGVNAVNQVSTFADTAGSGINFESSLSAAVATAEAGDVFKINVGGASGATYQVTVGSQYSAGQYSLDALASDLTADDRTTGGAQTTRVQTFTTAQTNAFLAGGAAEYGTGDAVVVTVTDGTDTLNYTAATGTAVVASVTALVAALNAGSAGTGETVTFSEDNGALVATFDTAGTATNGFDITVAGSGAIAGSGSATAALDTVGTEGGNTSNVFNDVSFSTSGGSLVATFNHNGAITGTNVNKAALSNVAFDDGGDGTFKFVGSNSALQTTAANAISRVESIASPSLGSADFSVGDTLKVSVGATEVSHTLSATEAADINSAANAGKVAKIASLLSTAADTAGAGSTNANLLFSGVGNDLRVTFENAGANSDVVSGLKIDRAEVDQGTATKTSDGVNSLKAYSASETGTGSVAENSADYGRNNTATGNNTDAVATATLGGSYAAGSGATTIAATSTITNIVEAAKVQIGLDVLGSDFEAFRTANANGEFTIGGTDGTKFEVSREGVITNRAPMDFETTPNFTFDVTYTAKDGSKFTETVNLQLSDSQADSGDHLINVSVATQALAGDSIAILDQALNQVSAAQAELGAVQNRLQHNIDNLTMGAMLTETSKGRITDADFAKETTQLSKQQILAQAATSMLAQANQSKQSVLSLLQ